MSDSHGKVFIISGPSGVGKGTICQRLQDEGILAAAVSATTRAPRDGEVDGLHYHFLSREEFQRRIDAGELLEWAEYNGNLYGTLATEVEPKLAAGQHVFLEIEIQGVAQLRERGLPVMSVFLQPPSLQALRERLELRGQNTPDEIKGRVARAEEELAEAPQFDRQVVNDDLEQAVEEVRAIIRGFGG